MQIWLKRAYEDPGPQGGTRVLVDRLWPSGVSTDAADIDLWLKEIAPTDTLRKWFGHDPGKLFGLDMRKWPKKNRRFRRDTYPGEQWNLGDLILWHGHRAEKDGSIFWETPLGKGRPAWNVQDSAIISSCLGSVMKSISPVAV